MVGLIVNGTGNAEKISALLVKSLEVSGVKAPKVNVVYAGGTMLKSKNCWQAETTRRSSKMS